MIISNSRTPVESGFPSVNVLGVGTRLKVPERYDYCHMYDDQNRKGQAEGTVDYVPEVKDTVGLGKE